MAMDRHNKKFQKSLKKYLKKVDKVGTKGIRSVALMASKLLMVKSPVDFGTFRGNWNVGINGLNLSVDEDAGGNTKKYSVDKIVSAKHNSVIGSIKLGDTVNISNALPYAMRLENGYSDQAPIGMVTTTLIELKNKLDSKHKKV